MRHNYLYIHSPGGAFSVIAFRRHGIAQAFLSVRPSVCPSEKRVHCDKTKEPKMNIVRCP